MLVQRYLRELRISDVIKPVSLRFREIQAEAAHGKQGCDRAGATSERKLADVIAKR